MSGQQGSGLEHVVITRFNVRMASVVNDKNGQRVLTAEWLDHRIELFEGFCLPSLRSQTLRDFRWILLVDEGTPARILERLRSHEGPAANLEVAPIPMIHQQSELAPHIVARLRPDTRTLVSTRLDTDDAFHENALARIRERVRDRREFINPRYGYVTDGYQARVTTHKYSPFATYVEPDARGSFQTVYVAKHGRIGRVAPVRQIADEPLWMRLIHDRNWVNREGVHGFGQIRSVRGFHKWVRRGVILPLRKTLWPAEYKRSYPLAELPAFHVSPPPGLHPAG
ncbi:MAG TPA: glycosyltransferase [Longimicrobium sp.]|uniref:glycosyltransferase n=1 Tax=Longimicrobium sp. TaxID=2029185 RepID=UPI002EDB2E6B